MLLSHHVPTDYDRTCTVGSVRICTRCLGVVVGATAALVCWRSLSVAPSVVFMIAAVPGVLDFVIHEVGLSASSSARRFLTGLLFGAFAAALLRALVAGSWVKGAGFIGWLLLLQATSALALKRSGRLDQLLRRYEDGVYIHQ